MSLTYVVPDLHGRYDLLCAGLDRVFTHAAGEAGSLILLGDYVDKGPQSREIIEHLLSRPADQWRFVTLKGNHEVLMVEALRDPGRMAAWLDKGGDAVLSGYGGDPAAVPQGHVAWLDGLPLMHLDEHRIYVHAGLDAGVPLDRQSETTLLNKRYPKGDEAGFGTFHVVHGHDNCPQGPLLYQGRSNLDALAWRTGRLVIGVFDDANAGGPVDLIEVRGPPADR